MLHRAEFSLSVEKLSGLPAESEAEVVFAGRSNAGKSSALNALTGRRALARVSKTPGRTRLINFFALLPGAYLVDLPGYGYAKVPGEMKRGWEELLAGYLQTREQICGLVVVMDVRHALTELDRELLEWFRPRNRPVLLLLSKADKLSKSKAAAQLLDVRKRLGDRYPGCTAQLFSSTSKLGVEEADAVICDWLGQAMAAVSVE
jgi:GTP-binding protein